MTFHDLPAANAALNGAAFLAISAGLWAVKTGRVALHKKLMATALGLSALFLVSYLTYHAVAGTTYFTTPGLPRIVYLTILLTHTILAVAVAVLAPFAVYFALSGRIERHKRLAKFLAPIWLYVSASGVLIYFMLYWIWPAR